MAGITAVRGTGEKAWVELPEPLTGLAATRTERHDWQRLGKAEGLLVVGFDEDDQPVRVDYHWWRFYSRNVNGADDVYTAERWVKQPAGHWLYIVQPGAAGFVSVEHRQLRPLLADNLNVDIGPS